MMNPSTETIFPFGEIVSHFELKVRIFCAVTHDGPPIPPPSNHTPSNTQITRHSGNMSIPSAKNFE
ncbi:MAG: hypothetical protein ACFFHV_23575 [Promethearchaeota archaeon]